MCFRSIHPLVNERDVVSIAQTNLSTDLQTVSNAVVTLQSDNLKALSTNRELALTLLDLSRQVKVQDPDQNLNGGLREELEAAKADTKESKRRWRTAKGIAAAVVAGSGVDWASDVELTALVLDEGD